MSSSVFEKKVPLILKHLYRTEAAHSLYLVYSHTTIYILLLLLTEIKLICSNS